MFEPAARMFTWNRCVGIDGICPTQGRNRLEAVLEQISPLIGRDGYAFHPVLDPATHPFENAARGEVLRSDHVVRSDHGLTAQTGTELAHITGRFPRTFGNLGEISLYVIPRHGGPLSRFQSSALASCSSETRRFTQFSSKANSPSSTPKALASSRSRHSSSIS